MGAAQQRLDAQVQLFGVEGFGQVIVGAGLEAFDPFGPGITGGEDQHWRRQTSGPPLRQHLEPWQTRQAEVEDDQVIRLAAALIHRVATVGQPVHGVTLSVEAGHQFVGQRHMVFHQKQTHRSIFPVFQ